MKQPWERKDEILVNVIFQKLKAFSAQYPDRDVESLSFENFINMNLENKEEDYGDHSKCNNTDVYIGN